MRHIIKVEIWEHHTTKPPVLLGTASERLDGSIVLEGKYLKDAVEYDVITIDGKKDLGPKDGQNFMNALLLHFNNAYAMATPIYSGEGRTHLVKHDKKMK